MTITNSFGSEVRMKHTKPAYMCPICNVSWGYVKEKLSMNLKTHCSACNYFGRVSEFIPEVQIQ
jgi:hypothetical protein